MIPYGRQDINQGDIDAVSEALRSDWLTQGPAVPRFEAALGEVCGAPHVVATSNATTALHIAALALGLGPGERLWTVPNTFVASANCGLYCGAEVDFVDIDPLTRNMSVAALSAKLEAARQTGRLPRVVVPVDFAGTSVDLQAIRALANEYGFSILEDAAHAVGGRYRNHPVGDGELADISVFSFHPVKIVTTGEGGAAATRSEELATRMRLLRSHGITRDSVIMSGVNPHAADEPWYYEQVDVGNNYRMTDLQAALGASQLMRLSQFLARRQEVAARYHDILGDMPVIRQFVPDDTYSALHLYVIELGDEVKQSRRAVFRAMRDQGIGVNVHYIPVHLQPVYRGFGFGPGDFPAAERYYDRALTLPLFPSLTEAMQDKVVEALKRAIDGPAG
jgi:UDP-4-amino-4,6-dideoxy-N-acetyl-beta-L-altrosamine transaminase